jgi:ribonuclease HI
MSGISVFRKKRAERKAVRKLREEALRRQPAADDIQIWTDGSTRTNPGPGGYAALVIDGAERREVTGFDPATTNNRMELTAIIRGLAAADPARSVSIFSDSTYALLGEKVIKAGKPRLHVNADLWIELLAVAAKRSAPIAWVWVRSHSGITNNEHADTLAKQASLAA